MHQSKPSEEATAQAISNRASDMVFQEIFQVASQVAGGTPLALCAC